MKRLTTAIVATLASPALLHPAVLRAEPATQPEVVVTATRSARTVDETLASVTVLTREDIERSQAPDLLELLRTTPGIDVARTGGAGHATTLFVRGGNSNHALVLIDGVRVANTGQGLYDFAHLPLAQIERIEIVRGPRASYWGADALSGVIQIFTRNPDGVSAHARAGSDGRYGASASYGTRGDARFGVTLGGESYDGFSAQNPRGFSFDPDDDGYHNRNASVRGAIALGTQSLEATALSTDADVEFDDGETSATDRSGALTLAGPLGANWSHRATLGLAWGELETPAFGSRFDSRRQTLDWQHDVTLGTRDALAFGVNLLEEQGRSLDLFGNSTIFDEERDNRGIYAAWHRAAGAWSFELAGRHDDDSNFDGETTGQIALGRAFGEGVRAFASLGEGFRAPNLNELYSPGFGGQFAGNPALEPERSRSAELGVDFAPAAGQRVEVRGFRSRVRDLVSFEGERFGAINIARASIDGAELRWVRTGAAWFNDASYTFQDAENERTGTALLRRPRHKLAASLGRRHEGGLEWAVEGVYADERLDFGGNELGSYTLANARVAWPFAEAWRLEARLDNAFDRDYELAYGFNTPDRSWLLGVVYTP